MFKWGVKAFSNIITMFSVLLLSFFIPHPPSTTTKDMEQSFYPLIYPHWLYITIIEWRAPHSSQWSKLWIDGVSLALCLCYDFIIILPKNNNNLGLHYFVAGKGKTVWWYHFPVQIQELEALLLSVAHKKTFSLGGTHENLSSFCLLLHCCVEWSRRRFYFKSPARRRHDKDNVFMSSAVGELYPHSSCCCDDGIGMCRKNGCSRNPWVHRTGQML